MARIDIDSLLARPADPNDKTPKREPYEGQMYPKGKRIRMEFELPSSQSHPKAVAALCGNLGGGRTNRYSHGRGLMLG